MRRHPGISSAAGGLTAGACGCAELRCAQDAVRFKQCDGRMQAGHLGKSGPLSRVSRLQLLQNRGVAEIVRSSSDGRHSIAAT